MSVPLKALLRDELESLKAYTVPPEEFVDAAYRFEIVEGVSHWVPELASDDVSGFLIEHLAQ